MNFYDTIAERGYAIKKEESADLIHLVKDDGSNPPLVEAHIVFYRSKHEITGFLRTKDLIFKVNDMAIMYRVFLDMQEDLKFFAERSRYDII